MGNEEFALRCDFSRLTPKQDFQLISLDIPSWSFLSSGLKGQRKPPEVEASHPAAQGWGTALVPFLSTIPRILDTLFQPILTAL